MAYKKKKERRKTIIKNRNEDGRYHSKQYSHSTPGKTVTSNISSLNIPTIQQTLSEWIFKKNKRKKRPNYRWSMRDSVHV